MENLSALMDGELEDQHAERELSRLNQDAELRLRWEAFHLIGDAMRGERMLSAEFDALVMKRLAAEPTVLAPMRRRSTHKRAYTVALSAAASVSAAALVAWVAMTPDNAQLLEARVSAGQAAARVAPAPVVSVSSEGSMNEYLLAHQGFSPSTVLQGLAPYIRSVSARSPEGR